MHHLGTKIAFADFTEQAQLLVLIPRPFKLLDLTTVEVEKAQDQFAARIAHPRHQLPPWTKLHIDIDHRRLDLYRHAPRRRVNRRDTGFVLVTHRQMQHEVIVTTQAEFVQSGLEGGWGRDFVGWHGEGWCRRS